MIGAPPSLDPLRLSGTAAQLVAQLGDRQALAAVARVRHLGRKGSVAEHEALALYRLARVYNQPGAHFLELGTLYGRTAALLAEAAPRARIATLNPAHHEFVDARQALRPWPNVTCYRSYSWEWLRGHYARQVAYDLIFVDGDHAAFARDLPWWNAVKVGGLFLAHDDNDWQSPPVKAGLDALGARLGRLRDVEVRDSERIGRGLSGFYRRPSDPDLTP